jgi:hypothetical protein
MSPLRLSSAKKRRTGDRSDVYGMGESYEQLVCIDSGGVTVTSVFVFVVRSVRERTLGIPRGDS